MLRSSPFHLNMNLSLSLSIFTHRDGRVLGTVCRHSRDIQYVSVHNLYFCSYNFHISRFSRSGTCKLKRGKVNVYRLCPNMVQKTVLFLSRSLVTPRHRWIIMNKVVNPDSLRKICHYRNSVAKYELVL